TGAWMTNAQFLDGVALSGIIPAPFIIFATFVGFIGGGAVGAVVLTFGVFLPAFAFTLLAHQPLERATRHPAIRAFLDGVTAGVVGLIAATSLVLFAASVRIPIAMAIFLAALAALYAWKAKAAVAVVILGAGALGVLIFR
ncbi:MAG: chromate transporter, partial [bacterium]